MIGSTLMAVGRRPLFLAGAAVAPGIVGLRYATGSFTRGMATETEQKAPGQTPGTASAAAGGATGDGTDIDVADIDLELDMAQEKTDLPPEEFEVVYKQEELDRPVDIDSEMDMAPEEVTPEDFEPVYHEEPLDRPVNLDVEFDMNDSDLESESEAEEAAKKA